MHTLRSVTALRAIIVNILLHHTIKCHIVQETLGKVEHLSAQRRLLAAVQ